MEVTSLQFANVIEEDEKEIVILKMGNFFLAISLHKMSCRLSHFQRELPYAHPKLLHAHIRMGPL